MWDIQLQIWVIICHHAVSIKFLCTISFTEIRATYIKGFYSDLIGQATCSLVREMPWLSLALRAELYGWSCVLNTWSYQMRIFGFVDWEHQWFTGLLDHGILSQVREERHANPSKRSWVDSFGFDRFGQTELWVDKFWLWVGWKILVLVCFPKWTFHCWNFYLWGSSPNQGLNEDIFQNG